jgi:(p)ppGpp synthase/HD superfamily hydrolase
MNDEKLPAERIPMLTQRLAQTLTLAIEAHDGFVLKGTAIPYISQPMAVAAIALEHGADEDQAIAALLHDAVEDGGAPYAPRIREAFGDRVADIVDGCTDGMPDASGEKEEWKTPKERYLAHLPDASDDVMLVNGADKLHNARAIVSDLHTVEPAVFDRFTATQSETLWYYDELTTIHIQRATPVARALRQTVDRMHELGGAT